MKRQKKLLIMLAVLALILCAYFITSNLTDEEKSSSSGADFIQVLSAPRDEIMKMSWEYSGNSFTLVRDETASDWYCPEDNDRAIDQTFSSAMLSAIYSVTASSSIEPADELSAYGLDPSVLLVTITLADGSEHTLTVGMFNSFADGYYALSESSTDEIYIISSDVFKAFAYSLDDITLNDEAA